MTGTGIGAEIDGERQGASMAIGFQTKPNSLAMFSRYDCLSNAGGRNRLRKLFLQKLGLQAHFLALRDALT